MATFVHITPEKNAARIRRAGLKAVSTGRLGSQPATTEGIEGPGVYVFPRIGSFTLTYQWVREIARFHVRQPLVAVTARIPDDELVTVGRYTAEHCARTAARAVAQLRDMDDPRGWEVLVPRRIEPAEIRSIRPAPLVGWRYFPDAHGRVPCTCQGCRDRGLYNSARLARARPDELDGPFPSRRALLTDLAEAAATGDHATAAALMEQIGAARGRQRWRGPVGELADYVDHPDAEVRRQLVLVVMPWRSPGVDDLLARLARDQDAAVRDDATWALSRRQQTLGTPGT